MGRTHFSFSITTPLTPLVSDSQITYGATRTKREVLLGCLFFFPRVDVNSHCLDSCHFVLCQSVHGGFPHRQSSGFLISMHSGLSWDCVNLEDFGAFLADVNASKT